MFNLNGEFYDKEPQTDDFFYGYSLFETMYGIKNKVVFFEEHLNRLKKSADIIGISIKWDIKKEVYKLISKNGDTNEFMIKLQISNDNFYIKMAEFEGRVNDEGIDVSFIQGLYQNELGFVKSGNYLTNILARKNLKSFEGIFVNRLGIVTEGTISNLFFIKNEVIYTPSLDLNILPGITREKIICLAKKNNFEVQDGHFGKEDLLEADAVFLTNSLMKKGLLWVKSIENIEKNKTSQIHKLEKDYYKLIEDMIQYER